ncbi:MAG: SusC/RagA family TonB-linked outer membrane protein [Candidatus Cryptobacteroides sp.]
MKKICLLFTAILMLGVSSAFAQSFMVTGKVTDASSGEGIPFASVVVKGSNVGVNTDENGAYSIKASEKDVLVFSFVGYNAYEVSVNGRAKINVSLESESLDEVVMVAYGSAKKSSFTGSAASVKSESLSKRTVANVTKAIEGLVPGVTATAGSGQPGSGSSIQIRGYGSINASSSPLYVVDGIPYDGSISAINPSDIESLTVLKDAAAAALYGSRGANGVVMIQTKRGQSGYSNFNFKGTWGFSSRAYKPYDTVNQREFVELTYEALRNKYMIDNGYSLETASALANSELGASLGGEQYNPFKNYTWDTLIDPATGKVREDAVSAYDERWLDEMTHNNALRQEYVFSANGGNDKTKYAMSFGYLDEDGILITTKFRRYSFRANVDQKVTSWINAGVSTSYAYTKSNMELTSSGSYTSNAWYTAQFMAPIYPVYLKDENGQNAGGYDYGLTRPKASNFNNIGDLYDNKNAVLRDNTSARAYATLGGDDPVMGIFKGLELTTNVGIDISNARSSTYYNPYHGDGASTNGSVDKESGRTMSLTWNQILKYDRTFADKHHVLAQLGHEYYNYEYQYLQADRTNVYPGIDELAPATNVTGNNSYKYQYRIESYFGRLAYDFSDKYYFEGTWRTDGSSRFHKDYRWGQFWSLGASWRLSEENFMKNADWVDNMTLRLSYGQLGNDGLDTYYAWQSFYDLTWANATNPGAIVNSLENTEVSWEKKNTWNVGIEATLFHRFLNLSLEYYHSKTTDMLLSYPLPLSTGFSGYNANVGSLQNQGFEASFRFNWVNKGKFAASSTLMLYKNENKILALTKDDKITSGYQVIEVGKPIYTYCLPKNAGVDPATGKQLYWAYEKDDNGDKIEGSDFVTSNKTLASNSYYYAGSREPDLQGSFGSDFRLGSFDLSFLTTFSIGGVTYDSLYSGLMEVQYAGDTWSKNALRRWQKPGDVTDVPAVLFNAGRLGTDKNLINASYFAIKSIQLGYTLPEKWTRAAKLHSLRVFVNADNVAMFNHLHGLNVQYNFSGGTNYTYTPTRVVSVGVDLNF